jgi:putative phosphoribosyl transferase
MSEIFEDRKDAGKKLAAALTKKSREGAVVVAIPRGGVAVALEVARELQTPLELLFVRRLGAEFNPELSVGAIVEGDPTQVSLNQELIRVLKMTDAALEAEKQKQLTTLKDQMKKFRGSSERLSLKGKKVILIDDGIATGASIHAALKAIKAENPTYLCLAVPVGAPDTMEGLAKEVDEVVCLKSPKDFQAVGQFYRNFPRMTDDGVVALLQKK